jgi:hypothetical protein
MSDITQDILDLIEAAAPGLPDALAAAAEGTGKQVTMIFVANPGEEDVNVTFRVTKPEGAE